MPLPWEKGRPWQELMNETCKALPTTQALWVVITNSYYCENNPIQHLSGWAGGRPGRGCGRPGSSFHLCPRTLLPRECFQLSGMLGAVGATRAQPNTTLLVDGAGEDLARGCVVPGVTSIYRRIPDTAQGCSLDSWKGNGEQRNLRRQVPLLKLASRDSGVEVVVGDSTLATSLGLSQDTLEFEAMGNPKPLAPPMEPPAHLGRFLASHKLEQVLERSRQLPTSPAGLSQHHHSPKLPSKLECETPLFGAGDQKPTKAEVEEAGPEEAEMVSANSQAG